ncbi:hypothetical protein G6O69_19710 [Pseudenhygromyxa sp. WMMC2535]|uniref:hypothetical protein n=1 Tax=Pseudenhygromyxa sp. WMMC2535 TaxID=2712867 RepID=UPI001557A0D2|nr:hypothetical protein [Pseudenhygromyxa sp. WMMC2535]NVB40082.1 hypothetical protein [Pseudenhygromyxa sp. WMMC2535]
MAVSNVVVCRPFLSEVEWAKKTVIEINDYKSKNWAIGLNGDTGKPDGFTVSFAERDMNFVTYIRGAGLSIGSPAAYDQNIAMLTTYIDRERQEEVSSVNGVISQLNDYKSRNWAIGLSWPDGQPDGFTRYFAVRELPIQYYLRGNISVGEPSAYDANIKTLQGYLEKVGNAKLG